MLSVALQPGKVKRARHCDGYGARTFGVCKGRRKVGLCLCVDLAADADDEHCRPWCDWIEALAELNLEHSNLGISEAELFFGPLSNGFTATSRRGRSCLVGKPRGNGESNDSPTLRPSASHVRICLLFSHINQSKELGFLTPRMELPYIAMTIRSVILVHIKP